MNTKRKIIIDQDAHGPASTNLQSILMLLQAPDVEVLGICVVSGDGWCDENLAHTLRFLEIAGRTDVPVFRGAMFPLLNSQRRMLQWEGLHGQLFWKGAWTERFYDGRPRPGAHPSQPRFVPELAEGTPTTLPAPGSAAEFMVRSVRAHPGEVSIWAAGPMTNLALAARLDPEFASLAGELFFMGGSFNPVPADNHFAQEYRHNPRQEFNLRWDPEAASLVLKEDWRRITQIPVDATTRTLWSAAHQSAAAAAGMPWSDYLGRFGRELPMWDEVAAALWLDPSLATRRETMAVDVDTAFTANYGAILSWPVGRGPGLGEQAVDVVLDIDVPRMERLALELLCGR
ncbi:nucleoside hydrolase [Variovorax rhizosphaerae]|uniref:Nucleoside hydrolase n=1 Tax=Variovorax rhizosphaerae TaxID=1836200 RepID=A0ABU8WNS9_9BURK